MSEKAVYRELAVQALRNIDIATNHYRVRINTLIAAIQVAHDFTIQKSVASSASAREFLNNSDVEDSVRQAINKLFDEAPASSATDLASSMRAAALILSHSHLDHSLNMLLFTCIFMDWPWWAERVAKSDAKKFSLLEAMQFDLNRERQRATLAYVNKQKQVSVPNRSDLLLKHVGAHGRSSELRRMSDAELKVFDERRHGIIHANKLLFGSINEEEEIQYTAALDHVENLTHSVADKLSINWDEITYPF